MMNNSTGYIVPTSFVGSVSVQMALSLLRIMMNIALLYAHGRDPCRILRCSSSPFIVNIAVIDFMSSCCFLTRTFLVISYFNFKVTMSPRHPTGLLNTVITFLQSISFSSFFCLSVERYTLVAYPALWHRVWITTRVVKYWLATLWLFHLTYEGLGYILIVYDYLLQWTLNKRSFAWVTFFLTQMMYFAAYISLRRQRKQLSRRNDLGETSIRIIQIRLKNENDFLLTIAIVCSVLVLTLLPMLIMFITMLSADGKWTFANFLNPVMDWGVTASTVNFVANGLIYLWRVKKYRRTFEKLYCQCFSLVHISSLS